MDRRTAQMYRAAQLYYEQDLNQQAISEAMDVSRATVSRLLTDARALGVVTITIDQPAQIVSDISEELRSSFGLRDAIVVANGADDAASMVSVGKAAADLLEGIITPRAVLAISWGRTLARMVVEIEPREHDGVEVVQMLGSLGEGDPAIDGPELARLCAHRLGGTYRYVHAPAVFKTAELCEELRDQPQVKETLRRAAGADIAITSVGSLANAESSLERNGYLTDAERLDYADRGAVGHLLAKLIDIDGNEFEPFNSRVLAVPLDALADRRWSICLGTGAAKGAVLLGGVRAGFINALVVDEYAAQTMLELQ